MVARVLVILLLVTTVATAIGALRAQPSENLSCILTTPREVCHAFFEADREQAEQRRSVLIVVSGASCFGALVVAAVAFRRGRHSSMSVA